jgi:hypothetical protein
MKKRVKRTKAKSASKRARTKSKTKKTTKAKTPAKTKKTLLPKVQRVAKKAALAAGMAAIGTALSELQPEQKSAQQNASDHGKSKRGNSSEDRRNYGCSSLLLVRPCNRQVDVQDPAPAASLPKGGVVRVVCEKRTGLISSAGGRQIPCTRPSYLSWGATTLSPSTPVPQSRQSRVPRAVREERSVRH